MVDFKRTYGTFIQAIEILDNIYSEAKSTQDIETFYNKNHKFLQELREKITKLFKDIKGG